MVENSTSKGIFRNDLHARAVSRIGEHDPLFTLEVLLQYLQES